MVLPKSRENINNWVFQKFTIKTFIQIFTNYHLEKIIYVSVVGLVTFPSIF